MDYLYKDADGYYLMDPGSYEQIQLDKHHLAPFDPFLQPDMKLNVEFLGEEPIHAVFPESDSRLRRNDGSALFSTGSFGQT